jgi:hypothetical protein
MNLPCRVVYQKLPAFAQNKAAATTRGGVGAARVHHAISATAVATLPAIAKPIRAYGAS